LWAEPSVFFTLSGIRCPTVVVKAHATHAEWAAVARRDAPVVVVTGLADGVLDIAVDAATRTVTLSVNGTALAAACEPALARGQVFATVLGGAVLTV
jgi:hypothetical protein